MLTARGPTPWRASLVERYVRELPEADVYVVLSRHALDEVSEAVGNAALEAWRAQVSARVRGASNANVSAMVCAAACSISPSLRLAG